MYNVLPKCIWTRFPQPLVLQRSFPEISVPWNIFLEKAVYRLFFLSSRSCRLLSGAIHFVVDYPWEEREMGLEGMNFSQNFLFSWAYYSKELASKWAKHLNSSCPAKRSTFFHFQINLLLRGLIAKKVHTHICHFISPCLLLLWPLFYLPRWFNSATWSEKNLGFWGKGSKI